MGFDNLYICYVENVRVKTAAVNSVIQECEVFF